MHHRALTIGLSSFLLLGAGCTVPSLSSMSLFPKELAATELDLASGTTIQLQASSLTPLNIGNDAPVRSILISDWQAGQAVTMSWSEFFKRETAASIEARSIAERSAGVGEEANIPEPVYETISRDGALYSDALDDGHRILLPSAWPEETFDLGGKDNALIWLSRAQYDELAETRYTHLEIGSIDARLQDAAQAVDVLNGILDKIRGSDPAVEVSEQDITEIAASPDWGSYTQWR
jgi:hypothetical protein